MRTLGLAVGSGRAAPEVFSVININLALVEDGKAFAYRVYA